MEQVHSEKSKIYEAFKGLPYDSLNILRDSLESRMNHHKNKIIGDITPEVTEQTRGAAQEIKYFLDIMKKVLDN